MTLRKGKSKKRDAFFFDTCLIFPPFFSFNIIEKRKKGAISPLSQRKSIYLQTDLEYRIDMKKEKNFSETDFQKKALESLSDDEILQGFKDADARIVREYYYGYCRVAYCIYDKRYDLQHKLGMMASRICNEEAAEESNTLNNSNMEDKKKGRITPSWIDSLKENEIFVFGSNLAGMHGGGAARIARLHFGAVMGKGVGLQGQSYAIPTMQGGVETIRPYVEEFIIFAHQHPDLHFLVTPIGCGIAGFEAEDIAPLFENAKEMKNISLPESFWEVIE